MCRNKISDARGKERRKERRKKVEEGRREDVDFLSRNYPFLASYLHTCGNFREGNKGVRRCCRAKGRGSGRRGGIITVAFHCFPRGYDEGQT